MVEHGSLSEYWAKQYVDQKEENMVLEAKVILLEADLRSAEERIKMRDIWIKALEGRINEQKKERNGN